MCTWFSLAPFEAKFSKSSVDFLVPTTRWLLCSIQRLLEFADQVLAAILLHPIWNLHAYVFLAFSVQESSFHIHLVQYPIQMCRMSQKRADRCELHNGCKYFSLIHPLYPFGSPSNQERFGNIGKAPFVIYGILPQEDRLIRQYIPSLWFWHQRPNDVLLEGR